MDETYIDMHLAIESEVNDELVSHLDAKWFHWVLLPIEERTNLVVVKVRNSRHIYKL